MAWPDSMRRATDIHALHRLRGIPLASVKNTLP